MLLITFDQLEEEVPVTAQTIHQERQEGEQEVSSKASMNTAQDSFPLSNAPSLTLMSS